MKKIIFILIALVAFTGCGQKVSIPNLIIGDSIPKFEKFSNHQLSQDVFNIVVDAIQADATNILTPSIDLKKYIASVYNEVNNTFSLESNSIRPPPVEPPGKRLLQYQGTASTNFFGQQGILIIGDSTFAGGAASTNSTLPAAGTAFEYDRNTSTILNFGAGAPYPFVDGNFSNNPKSPWAKFCIDYYNTFGKRPVIINRGCSGSMISPQGTNTNNWTSAGTNYASAVSAANDCLSKLKTTKLAAIIIGLGVNDASQLHGSSTLANVLSDWNTLLTNLISQFGSDVPIFVNIPGKYGTIPNDDIRIVTVRSYVRNAASTYSNVYCMHPFGWIFAAGGSDDGLHPNTSGNDWVGTNINRMFINYKLYSNKYAVAIMSSMYTDHNSTQKTKINTFITNHQTEYLNALDVLYPFKGFCLDQKDTYFEWTMLHTPPTDNGHTLSSGAYIATNGSSTYFHTGHNDSLPLNFGQDDYYLLIDINANGIATGTAACALKVRTGSNRSLALGQNTTAVIWNVRHNTDNTYATDNSLKPARYRLERSASNSETLFKNGTSIATSSTASVGLVGNGTTTTQMVLGANDNDGTFNQYMSIQVPLFVIAKLSGITVATLEADLDTMQN